MQTGKPNIVIVQDALLSLYLMSKHTEPILESTFMNLCMIHEDICIWDLDRIDHIERVVHECGYAYPRFCGRTLISLILPDTLNVNVFDTVKNNQVIIKQGVMLEGFLDKSFLGKHKESLIKRIISEYGMKRCVQFINECQFLGYTWITWRGFSIGLDDCCPPHEEKQAQIISGIVAKCSMEARMAQDRFQNTNIREVRVMDALNKAKDVGLKLARDNLDESNALLHTVTSGSKGDFFNVAQITGLLGQQNINGQRIRPTLTAGFRTLPHYPLTSHEDDFTARGFVEQSFVRGLDPRSAFLHAISGREGVCDTAVGTAITGYIQRRMAKLLECIQIAYDSTVSDSKGRIYQFAYNITGSNPAQESNHIHHDVWNIRSFVTQLNMRYVRENQLPVSFEI